MKNLSWTPNTPDENGWKARHLRAVLTHPIGIAINSWLHYADAHERQHGSKIGDDYVLGDAWARWAYALRELLNGDTGQMDCGTLDTILCDNLVEQGFDPDVEQRAKVSRSK